MNQYLEEVNELYLQIQGRYMDISPENKYSQTPEAQGEFANHLNEYSRIYNLALEKFRIIAPNLSPAEIIEGYQQGCRLLQCNLSGDMCQNFDTVYIPTMVQAIKNNETHTSHMFLQALADQLGKEISPIVIETLNSESALMRETALSVAEQIKLLEAAPKIRMMINDVELDVAFLAKKIIASWESQ